MCRSLRRLVAWLSKLAHDRSDWWTKLLKQWRTSLVLRSAAVAQFSCLYRKGNVDCRIEWMGAEYYTVRTWMLLLCGWFARFVAGSNDCTNYYCDTGHGSLVHIHYRPQRIALYEDWPRNDRSETNHVKHLNWINASLMHTLVTCKVNMLLFFERYWDEPRTIDRFHARNIVARTTDGLKMRTTFIAVAVWLSRFRNRAKISWITSMRPAFSSDFSGIADNLCDLSLSTRPIAPNTQVQMKLVCLNHKLRKPTWWSGQYSKHQKLQRSYHWTPKEFVL